MTMTEGSNAPDVSIIIPVLNEEENIRPLVEEIIAAMGERSYEILFVDDGSTDATVDIILELKSSNSRIRILKLKRNFGKSTAMAAGFDAARGETSITMDGDLQDDPAEIPRFLASRAEGNDIVCGWRAKRNDNIFKRWPSKIYNKMSRRIAGVKIHDMNCGFKAYDTELAQSLNLYGDMHRYTPVLGKMNGAKVSEIAINHRKRIHGKSKYGAKRIVRGLLDLVTVGFLFSFLERPLHLFGRIGTLISLVGFGICGYLVTLKYAYGEGIGERPLLMLGVLLITLGVQLFMLGLLGETIVYRSSQHRQIQFFSKEL
jgi:glycosyltransferase involved in cell wall biosynthesis